MTSLERVHDKNVWGKPGGEPELLLFYAGDMSYTVMIRPSPGYHHLYVL